MISGGITFGIGYIICYSALKGITSVQAAVVQLMSPVITAFGGVLIVVLRRKYIILKKIIYKFEFLFLILFLLAFQTSFP